MRYVCFKDDFKGFDNGRETLSMISGLIWLEEYFMQNKFQITK